MTEEKYLEAIKQIHFNGPQDPTEKLCAQIDLAVRNYMQNADLNFVIGLLIEHHGKETIVKAVERA